MSDADESTMVGCTFNATGYPQHMLRGLPGSYRAYCRRPVPEHIQSRRRHRQVDLLKVTFECPVCEKKRQELEAKLLGGEAFNKAERRYCSGGW